MYSLLAASAVVVAGACLASFLSWRRGALARLRRCSEIAETSCGPVEFTKTGTGPVILHLHGGATGCDQTLALSWDLHEAGFAILTPSRPGYLRTPLATGAAPEEAADAVAALLDLLGIGSVCVMGTSGGGPTALQFALRHPQRLRCLVLQSAVSQLFVEPRRSTHSLIGRLVFSRWGNWLTDFGSWVVHLLARYWPALLVRTLLHASESLEGREARERCAFVTRHTGHIAFFRRLVACGIPLSVRRAGIWNDLDQYARLPVYPLERIACPTLVLHGRADGNVPLAHAEFIGRTVPHAELVIVEGCGHLIWIALDAAAVREKVAAFLNHHAYFRKST